MNHLFIITTILFLSCKNINSEKTTTEAQIDVAENMVEILKSNPEIPVKNSAYEDSAYENTIKNEEKNTNQDYIKSVLYKGALNGNIKITLYLKEEENACGGDLTYFIGMYKYDHQDKWILLNITTDRQNKNYCMVEDGFSGVLFLQDNEGSFYGNWISTDTKKQFKVELENQLLDIKYAKDHTVIEKLDEILFDDLIYGKNDC